MAILIESRDGRFYAAVTETDEGVEWILYRTAGRIDDGRGGRAWRQMEHGIVPEIEGRQAPLHAALNHIERLVWPMVDDRPRNIQGRRLSRCS